MSLIYECVCVCVHRITISEKGGHEFGEEWEEGYMVVFEGRNGKGEMLLYYYLKINLKFKISEDSPFSKKGWLIQLWY